MENIPARDETWSGGDFELYIELGDRSGERLQKALDALDAHPALGQGLARMPNGIGVEYRVSAYYYGEEEEEDSELLDSSYWLRLGVPMGALGKAYPVGAYPFEDGSPRDWLPPVYEWFRDIGQAVFRVVEFQFGIVGWEVDTFLIEKFEERGVPDVRWNGFLVSEGGGLKWYPPNADSAPMTI